MGILSLEKAQQRRHDDSSEWHAALMIQLGEINERMGRLENMFVSQHVPRRGSAEVYDWDQVLSKQMEEMIQNKPEDS